MDKVLVSHAGAETEVFYHSGEVYLLSSAAYPLFTCEFHSVCPNGFSPWQFARFHLGTLREGLIVSLIFHCKYTLQALTLYILRAKFSGIIIPLVNMNVPNLY